MRCSFLFDAIKFVSHLAQIDFNTPKKNVEGVMSFNFYVLGSRSRIISDFYFIIPSAMKWETDGVGLMLPEGEKIGN